MKRLLYAGIVGVLMVSGCSHQASDQQPAQAPTPPPAVKSMPPNAQGAIGAAVPAGDMKNVQPKGQ